MNFIVTHQWRDSRLHFEIAYKSDRCIEGDAWHAQRIWLPSIYYVNERESRILSITHDNVYLQICTDGTIIYQYR